MPTRANTASPPPPDLHLDDAPELGDVDRFLDNASDYFDNSLTKLMGLPRAQLDTLQLAGLKRRFGQFRCALPMLDKLADSQGISAIGTIEDVLPLLFDHATYKSYPASLLDKHRYAQLTAWLNKLTTVDLSKVDVSGCRSIDEWIATLARETPLAVFHTSGTSGTMSFLPGSKAEFKRWISQHPTVFFQSFGEDGPAEKAPLNIDCIYPYFRSGAMVHTLANDPVVDVVAGGEGRFHAAYPGRLSSDLMLLAARRRVAAARGQLDQLEINPELNARREQFEAQQRDMPGHVARFFETMLSQLSGRRVFIQSATHLLFMLADNGLKRGMRKIFAPDSVVVTGGGGKGLVLPGDWQDTVREFFGVQRINVVYGMSEMAGQFPACEYGHYHGVPWVIPFILDPESGKPLPRRGTVTGRFAFYDLLPETRWGGFVTGDEVTMEWDAVCPCGRTTPYLQGTIQRYSDKNEGDGDDKLSCADTPAAYAEALDFLNAEVV